MQQAYSLDIFFRVCYNTPMKKTLPTKIVYYTDEHNDEFSSAIITPKRIDENWQYVRRGFWSAIKRFISYRLLAHPFGYLYCRAKLKWKVIGRKNLKLIPNKKQGYFLFGNHTQETADAFIPSLSVCPKSVYVIVHPNNVSMPYLGRVTPYMGALPLPDNLAAARNFKQAIRARFEEGSAIMIYPEAHIWPYYTGIRNFPATSFRYPVELNSPCFAITTTYQKRKRGIKPRAITYIDGPFYPDDTLPTKARAQDLRDRIYKQMQSRSALSDCEYIRYEPKNEEEK